MKLFKFFIIIVLSVIVISSLLILMVKVESIIVNEIKIEN